MFNLNTVYYMLIFNSPKVPSVLMNEEILNASMGFMPRRRYSSKYCYLHASYRIRTASPF
jgi:hypothetical protein